MLMVEKKLQKSAEKLLNAKAENRFDNFIKSMENLKKLNFKR